MTDYKLIQKYLKGNEASFDALVERYMAQIYRFVFTYVNNENYAQDITQEVFLKLWRNMKKIKKNKSFKSWIYTVAKNTALDFLKKKKSIPFSSFDVENGKNILTDSLPDGTKLPDKLSESLETSTTFLKAIGTLSKKYQLVFSLYYYQYFNFREIAEILKEPINTIKSRHRRGLILLKEVIDGNS